MDPHLRVTVVHLVDLSKECERVDGGEVIPKLWALAKNRTDVVGKLAALYPWDITQDSCLACGWMQNACEHFDRGGFARAVGTDKAEQLARFHLEGEFTNGFN